MNDRLSIRVTSFALAAVVTFSVLLGIDTLAQEQHASSAQISQSSTPDHVAAVRAATTPAGLGS